MSREEETAPSRALLKLSGEVLAGPSSSTGIDPDVLEAIAGILAGVVRSGARMAVVMGGGNFVRGRSALRFDRVRADYMGMLGTLINGLALEGALLQAGARCLLTSAIPVSGVAGQWDISQARRALDAGSIVLCAGGTGNPYLSTDTAAALRAVQLECSVLLKGTKVDGVYTGDPAKDPASRRYSSLTFDEYLERDLGVMDGAAIAVCREGSLPVVVFDVVSDPRNIASALARPEEVGTIIGGEQT
ncbi:uridine monophosphate kinase [Candidatus Fermentibacterales bacterium]|nr:uridine monophosphate kinase [Candidatus Fermentibacterales bacterium]